MSEGVTTGRRVLVTGATGFIGAALCPALLAAGFQVRAATRRSGVVPVGVEPFPVGDIDPDTDWKAALSGVDAVIHLAARVHVMEDAAADPLTEYRRANCATTANLARQSAAVGVRRLVFVSSIKVNGECTAARPFSAHDTPAPQDPYAISKWEAEQALQEVAASTSLEVVIVRPPLVYGPGVGGNFLRLLKLIQARVPLPLASIRNRRSLIYVGNLVDILVRCVAHPPAAGRTLLVSDGEDVSSAELVRRLAASMGMKSAVFPCPPFLLRGTGLLTGKRVQLARLTDSLQVDGTLARQVLDWTPPYSLEQGLAETANWFRTRGAVVSRISPTQP